MQQYFLAIAYGAVRLVNNTSCLQLLFGLNCPSYIFAPAGSSPGGVERDKIIKASSGVDVISSGANLIN